MSVRAEKRGAITVITIDRPEVRNAIDHQTAQALRAALLDFDGDAGAAVAVLTGAGGVFCAGFDLKAIGDPDRQPQIRPDGPPPMGFSDLLLTKPVIAAVEGYAVAAALELAGELTGFPQDGLRSDRLSVHEQWELPQRLAFDNERRRGLESIASGEWVKGASRFASGQGRHGKPGAPG